MTTPLQDLVVVVTGASSGIGAALALELSRRGCKVVLAARSQTNLEAVAATLPGPSLVVPTDVTVRSEVNHLLHAAVAQFGHVDVWVNNAGRGISRSVLDVTDEDLDQMVLVNVKSALYGMQAVVPHFKGRGRGHVINVSSMLGRIPFAPVRSAYSASKHMLNSLTANLRHELAASAPALHVSLVLPGVVATDFGLNALGGGVDSRHIPGAQPVEEVVAGIAELIAHPKAEHYTRAAYAEQVATYFGAEDVAVLEAAMPAFQTMRPRPVS